jgi:hypothetical protein
MTANSSDTSISTSNSGLEKRWAGWLRVAGIAAASALAGGLAAAWWHRKTLDKLREGEAAANNPDFSIYSADLQDPAEMQDEI